ncbi:MAG TPA: LLM class flavin-dependent oxidoreductase [Beijerinckiaceae bacterium]|nr:LLM class flavin-dependent oxidoreductase [Beijerinckiaceae bacterium]
MSAPVQLYAWHFMAYPYLPADFDEKFETGWVTVPNSLWDRDRSRGLYKEYIDQLIYASELGFDGMVLNEHHQNIYGLMPSPNLIAAVLAQKTTRGKIVILGNLLPLHMNPLRVAEEYAMLDNLSDGRLIAGFAPGSGPETFNYDVASAPSRDQFWEAVDLIRRAWTEPGPFAFEGRHYPLRYVNPWPLPTQRPHPPIWIPGARSRDTLTQIARHGYCYFLSSRSHGKETAKSVAQFAKVLEDHGDSYRPDRMGILMSAYVAPTDKEAQEESREGIWYFLKNCLKGHQRREGRQLTFGPGVPYIPADEWRTYLQFSNPSTPLLGDTQDWDDLQRSQSIIVGSPETVTRRFMDILEHAQVGHLLVQFHLGNMKDELARRSMQLFATEVAPRLREQSAELFARSFPDVAEVAP